MSSQEPTYRSTTPIYLSCSLKRCGRGCRLLLSCYGDVLGWLGWLGWLGRLGFAFGRLGVAWGRLGYGWFDWVSLGAVFLIYMFLCLTHRTCFFVDFDCFCCFTTQHVFFDMFIFCFNTHQVFFDLFSMCCCVSCGLLSFAVGCSLLLFVFLVLLFVCVCYSCISVLHFCIFAFCVLFFCVAFVLLFEFCVWSCVVLFACYLQHIKQNIKQNIKQHIKQHIKQNV